MIVFIRARLQNLEARGVKVTFIEKKINTKILSSKMCSRLYGYKYNLFLILLNAIIVLNKIINVFC